MISMKDQEYKENYNMDVKEYLASKSDNLIYQLYIQVLEENEALKKENELLKNELAAKEQLF